MANQDRGAPEEPANTDAAESELAIEDALTSDAFQAWLEHLPSIEVDGERLYLPTGDVPQGEHELAIEWLGRAPVRAAAPPNPQRPR